MRFDATLKVGFKAVILKFDILLEKFDIFYYGDK